MRKRGLVGEVGHGARRRAFDVTHDLHVALSWETQVSTRSPTFFPAYKVSTCP